MNLRRTPWLVAVAIGLMIVAAACTGEGDDVSAETSLTTTTTEAPTTTEPPTTTITAPTTTTSTIPPVTAPLTGEVYEGDESDLERRALMVKIGNSSRARPQSGLSEADIVIELRVEFFLTRFFAVFHSNIPDPIGPVRSSRSSDFDLLRGFNNPLASSSGGNAGVLGGLRQTDAVNVTNARLGFPYFRTSRPGPYNLYVPGDALYEYEPDEASPPSPWFEYRESGQSSQQGTEVDDVIRVNYRGGTRRTEQWDPDLQGWIRTQDGEPQTNVDGDLIAPENVVIMLSRYGVSAADANSPELISTGDGDAYVLTDGRVIQGTWSRPSATDVPTLLDENGETMLLTPGRTWVLYPESGNVELP